MRKILNLDSPKLRAVFIRLKDIALRLAFHPSLKTRIIFWSVVTSAILIALYSSFLFVVVSVKMSGKTWELPSKVYSSSFPIYPNMHVDQIQLTVRLKRLGYRQVKSGKAKFPGDFRVRSDRIEIYLKDFEYPDRKFEGIPVRLNLQWGEISSISRFSIEDGRDVELLAFVELEPELIAKFFGRIMEEREVVKLEKVPPHLINAIITIEDTRFYGHLGLDPRAILRALVVDIKSRSLVQGGSTITQQLVKNLFLSRKRTLWRKFNEALTALIIELRYSKSRILEAYLNEIYLGQSGPVSISGVAAGARFYFSKDVSALNLAESALLAGLIRAPYKYSPYIDKPAALVRRNLVLEKMLQTNRITKEEYEEALAKKVEVSKTSVVARAAPYYMDYLRTELKDNFSWEALTSEGLRVFTTLDAQMQYNAESVLSKELSNLERWRGNLRRHQPENALQGCLLALQPQTGQIKAMVGGRDYAKSQLNRIVQMKRQPGSAFKPIIFAAGFETASNSKDSKDSKGIAFNFNATTIFKDEPTEFDIGGKKWTPKNYHDAYYGEVTARLALEKSLNIPNIKIAQSTGLEKVISTAASLGIGSKMEPVLSVALGTIELTPLELATAYATFANGGVRSRPFSVIAVMNRKGKTITRKHLQIQPSISPQTAFLITNLLKGVLDRGTAFSARANGFYRAAAGKTGTTNDERDAWFVGYTPELLALVWVGFDDNTPIKLTAAQAAVPVWTRFMKDATSWQLDTDFEPPDGVVFRQVDRYSGYLATSGCPEVINEAFLKGSEPKEYCPQHEPLPEPEPELPFAERILRFLKLKDVDQESEPESEPEPDVKPDETDGTDE